MKDLASFKNVDIISCLESIVEAHVFHYKSDFYDLDIPIIQNMKLNEWRIFIPRECGTYLIKEADCYLEGTSYNSILKYPFDNALMFAVHVTEKGGDKVIGDVYELDYDVIREYFETNSYKPKYKIATYDGGIKRIYRTNAVYQYDSEFGSLKSWDYDMDDEEKIELAGEIKKYHTIYSLFGNEMSYHKYSNELYEENLKRINARNAVYKKF